MVPWVATLAFFFGMFLVGKFLQMREISQRLTKRAEDAVRNQVHTPPPGYMFGTLYGGPTKYERRKSKL